MSTPEDREEIAGNLRRTGIPHQFEVRVQIDHEMLLAELSRARARAFREAARLLEDAGRDDDAVTLLDNVAAGIEEELADVWPDINDIAWHAVWLYGRWKDLTSRMGTDTREHAAACVAREHARINADSRVPAPPLTNLRWWREPS